MRDLWALLARRPSVVAPVTVAGLLSDTFGKWGSDAGACGRRRCCLSAEMKHESIVVTNHSYSPHPENKTKCGLRIGDIFIVLSRKCGKSVFLNPYYLPP
jgi:hypothetical protein